MARLERSAHDIDITCAVECVVATAIGHLDELLLDALGAELGRVNKVGGTELLGPLLLGVVYINNDDLAGLVLDSSLDDRQTDATSTKDSNVGTLLNTTLSCGDDGSTVTGRDTAAKQAGAVHGGLLCDGND